MVAAHLHGRRCHESGRSDRWKVVGGLGVVTAYTIAITYAVVVGWVLWYWAARCSQGLLISMRQSPKPPLRVCWRTTSRW